MEMSSQLQVPAALPYVIFISVGFAAKYCVGFISHITVTECVAVDYNTLQTCQVVSKHPGAKH
jgi:hypothetical protein